MRTLLLIVALSGTFLGIAAQWLYQVRVQNAAIDALAGAGGEVLFDHPLVNDSQARRWLRSVFGDRAFGKVRVAMFDERTPSANQTGLAALPKLLHIVELDVIDRPLTASLVKIAAALPELKTLGVFNRRHEFDDDGLKHLGQLSSIETISLAGRVKRVLPHLDKLPNLREVRITATQIRGHDLTSVKGLRKLDTLYLDNNAWVSKEAIAELGALSRLQTLVLHNTNVGDADLEHLAKLENLRQLDLRKTNVTKDGVARLKQSLPNCEVYWGERRSK